MSNATKTLVLLALTLIAGSLQAIALPPIGTEPDAVAPAAPAPATPSLDGAQLFSTHCAMCHQPVTLGRRLQSTSGPEGAKAKMASFLAQHGRSDAAADAAIIDYLSARGSE